jgi:hypothetical protein
MLKQQTINNQNMSDKKQEQKEITVEQAANDVYAVLRGIKLMSNGQGLNADEHDALRGRMGFILQKAQKADELTEANEILKNKVKELELTIASKKKK